MTEQNTMPDEIFLSMGKETWEASVVSGDTKYIRADLVTDLIKRTREIVYLYDDEYCCPDVLKAIDEFMEKTK